MMDAEDRDYEAILRFIEGSAGLEEREETERRLNSEPSMKKLMQFAIEIRSDQGKTDYGKLRGSIHLLAGKQLREMKRTRSGIGHNAVTIYDSRLLPLPEGVRPATVDTRRLRFRSVDHELSLSAYPVSTGSYELIGQLTAGGCTEPLIAEVRVGKKRITAQANRFRVFRFPRVEVGTCKLTVKSAQRAIVVVHIDL
jgi:hypothetical protein